MPSRTGRGESQRQPERGEEAQPPYRSIDDIPIHLRETYIRQTLINLATRIRGRNNQYAIVISCAEELEANILHEINRLILDDLNGRRVPELHRERLILARPRLPPPRGKVIIFY